MEDIDLNLEDFVARVNADLVGRYVNIASRSAGFISKALQRQLAPADAGLPAIKAIRKPPDVAELYEATRNSARPCAIMALADAANQYVDSVKPWELAKQEGRDGELHAACSNAQPVPPADGVLKPVLPAVAAKVEPSSTSPLAWADAAACSPAATASTVYEHLMTAVDPS